jgi:hypothetical protein
MKHVTFATKSLLVGDEVADMLVEYCTLPAWATLIPFTFARTGLTVTR